VPCAPGAGQCLPFPHTCSNFTSCDAARYAEPAVAIDRSSTPEIAELARGGLPVHTFVIGVFGEEDADTDGLQRLDARRQGERRAADGCATRIR
jgi:hypothetical protein